MRFPIGQAILVAACAAISLGFSQTTIRTDVNLVQVHVKVTDKQGRIVTGLEKQAFQLLVDDAKQEITVFQGDLVGEDCG